MTWLQVWSFFGKDETFRKVFEKLMKSYAFSAMDASKPSQKYTFAKESAIEFIKAINSSETNVPF